MATRISPASQTRDDAYLANIALLYYQEGLTQNDIATRLGVSRATIVNYLKESKERGIVDIRVNGQSLRSSLLSKELSARYRLTDVYVAHVGPEAEANFSLRQTARVAAMAFHDIVSPGDVIGVAWGETVKQIADNLPLRRIAKTEVCQVIGSMESDRLLSAEDCAIQIANRIGARCHTLHAPAVLSSVQLAGSLREEPSIKTQLQRFSSLNVILTSVGGLSENTHVRSSGILDRNSLEELTQKGAVGFICSSFIKQDGSPLSFPIQDRMIAIQFKDILRTPKRIMVASGQHKLKAVKAALDGGHVTHAVLDDQLALGLLNE
jgi:deoxyribonucleoside regulator